MSECDRFPPKSRRRQICTGEADLPIARLNAYREKWGLEPLTTVPDIPRPPVVHRGAQNAKVKRAQRTESKSCVTCAAPQYGPGTELIAAFKKLGVPSCQQCIELAAQMDAWGVGGCRERLEEIVEDIFPRGKEWVANNRPWAHALLPNIVEDMGIRRTLKGYVTKAIDAADAKLVRKTAQYHSHQHRSSPAQFSVVGEPIFQIRPVIRTSPREKPTLDRTIESLERGGFEKPTVFADFGAIDLPLGTIQWTTKQGAFRGFVEMSTAILQKYSGWMLVCEDDVEFRTGVADYLRALNLSRDQVVSLYVSANQDAMLVHDGLNVVEGDMHGSLAYLIHSDTLSGVINSRTVAGWKYDQRVDRLMCQSLAEIGVALVCPRPSLAQHIGETSTLRANRVLDSARTSRNFIADRHHTDLVTVITPTGDRPEAFAKCERWMKSQRYTGAIQWIVIDDGHAQTRINDADVVLRPKPMRGHSLCRNLREALPYIEGQHILIVEDDDFYGADYVAVMVGRLQHADLVGERGAKYYFLRERRWRHRLNETHASLCRTGFNASVIDTLRTCITGTEHPSVDLRLWSEWKGSVLSWVDRAGDSRMCVGLKGVSGRQSYGWSPTRDSIEDVDGSVFRAWTGMSIDDYLSE